MADFGQTSEWVQYIPAAIFIGGTAAIGVYYARSLMKMGTIKKEASYEFENCSKDELISYHNTLKMVFIGGPWWKRNEAFNLMRKVEEGLEPHIQAEIQETLDGKLDDVKGELGDHRELSPTYQKIKREYLACGI